MADNEELLALATDLSNEKPGSRTRAVEMLRRLAAKSADEGVREGRDELTARATNLWAWLESFLENECALDTGCVSEADRSNLTNAIYNTLTMYSVRPDASVLAAAVEFLNSGDSLHKIRVNGKMMDRKEVASILSTPGAPKQC